jgi:hypothetical protein
VGGGKGAGNTRRYTTNYGYAILAAIPSPFLNKNKPCVVLCVDVSFCFPRHFPKMIIIAAMS